MPEVFRGKELIIIDICLLCESLKILQSLAEKILWEDCQTLTPIFMNQRKNKKEKLAIDAIAELETPFILFNNSSKSFHDW